jgi:serine/threonine protein kinase
VLHRDLKPTNVLVSDSGQPTVIDLGIAALLEPAWNGRLVAPAAKDRRWMTPHHASPEQLQGRPLTPASDVYSLGLLLYELLTGRHPFEVCDRCPPARIDLEELEDAVLHGRPRRPSQVVCAGTSGLQADPEGAAVRAEVRSSDPESLALALRGDLETVLLTSLQRRPARRQQSIAELRRQLTAALPTGSPTTRCSVSMLHDVSGGLLVPVPAP